MCPRSNIPTRRVGASNINFPSPNFLSPSVIGKVPGSVPSEGSIADKGVQNTGHGQLDGFFGLPVSGFDFRTSVQSCPRTRFLPGKCCYIHVDISFGLEAVSTMRKPIKNFVWSLTKSYHSSGFQNMQVKVVPDYASQNRSSLTIPYWISTNQN
ncbi:hypothetical protein PILCRDRAFT_830411, partial [Piloderma croceum F 1598]